MDFEPIAIISQAGLYPGAHSPESLFENCLNQVKSITEVPPGYWRIAPEKVSTSPLNPKNDFTWGTMGGYIHGFSELFHLKDYDLDPQLLASLDPVFQWLLWAVRQNFLQVFSPKTDLEKIRFGVIIGNLSYPSHELTLLAENIWLNLNNIYKKQDNSSPFNRFMSGFPAQLIAKTFGLNAPFVFCLDAACASALYAIELSCKLLHQRKIDVAITGGINHADDLFLHVGFCALQALSKKGISRPLHKEADGLIPAEGAGLIMLKRLRDALDAGDPILGLIRAVGLSNDGHSSGFLVPSKSGQVDAMKKAYKIAGLEPGQISWIECHATGTPVGDHTEIASMLEIFPHDKSINVGAIKGNIGHMITASAMPSLAVVLESFKKRLYLPTLYASDPSNNILHHTPFRLLSEPEPWETEDGVLLACINGFGFGGNNAHLILENWQKTEIPGRTFYLPQTDKLETEIVVVGIGAMAGNAASLSDFAKKFFEQNKDTQISKGIPEISLSQLPLKTPPLDLQQTLGQQLAVLNVVNQAITCLSPASLSNKTSVLIGMQCSTEITRYGLRWRLSALFDSDNEEIRDWINKTKDLIGTPLTSGHVIGAMPNIVANRINHQYNFKSPSFTLSAEELSGPLALEAAILMLQSNECDLAIAGAVDMNCDPVDQTLLKKALGKEQCGDAAFALALMRHSDAERLNLPVYAKINTELSSSESHSYKGKEFDYELESVFGYTHAASGMLHISSALMACIYRSLPGTYVKHAKPWACTHQHSMQVTTRGFSGQSHTVTVEEGCRASLRKLIPQPHLYCFAGDSMQQLQEALKKNHFNTQGSHKLALLVPIGQDYLTLKEQAQAVLSGAQSSNPNVYFSNEPLGGDLAYVFTGASTSYEHMGLNLVRAYPELIDSLSARIATPKLQDLMDSIYDFQTFSLDMNQEMQACSFLSQCHALFSSNILKLQPNAVIGYCSGETNAVVATGAWRDMEHLFEDIIASEMYTKHLSGEFQVLKKAWSASNPKEYLWSSWRVLHDYQEIAQLAEHYPLAHLAIINAPKDCIISGHPDQCKQIIERAGCSTAKELGFKMVIHCQDILPKLDMWHEVHSRKTYPVSDIRFYSSASGQSYIPTANNITQALVSQATQRVNFIQTIEQAYADGIRIFIEHGPRNLCANWISQILDKKPHMVLSYDAIGQDPLLRVYQLAAKLWVSGVNMHLTDMQVSYERE